MEYKDLDILLGIVSRVTKVSTDELKRKGRGRMEVTDARKVFWKVARETTKYGIETLGEYMNKDHSTVSAATKEAENILILNSQFRGEYEETLKQFLKHDFSVNSRINQSKVESLKSRVINTSHFIDEIYLDFKTIEMDLIDKIKRLKEENYNLSKQLEDFKTQN